MVLCGKLVDIFGVLVCRSKRKKLNKKRKYRELQNILKEIEIKRLESLEQDLLKIENKHIKAKPVVKNNKNTKKNEWKEKQKLRKKEQLRKKKIRDQKIAETVPEILPPYLTSNEKIGVIYV